MEQQFSTLDDIGDSLQIILDIFIMYTFWKPLKQSTNGISLRHLGAK